MNFNKKNIYIKVFGIFTAYNLIYYLFSHMVYMLGDSDGGIIFSYVNLFASKILEFLLLPAIVAVMLTLYTYVSTRSALLVGFIASLSRFIYAIPYYYLESYSRTFSSAEAIILSLLITLAVITCTYLFALCLFGVALLILRAVRGKGSADSFRENFSLCSNNDFLAQGNLPFTSACFIRFLAALVFEIVDTVSFFKENRYDYTWGEIALIAFDFVLIFALLIASYIISARIRKTLIERRLTTD